MTTIHIALYAWRETATQFEIDTALAAVRSIEALVGGIKRITTARNTSKYSEGYTHVIFIEAENAEAIEKYRAHPVHQKAAQLLDKIEDRGIGVDFTVEN